MSSPAITLARPMSFVASSLLWQGCLKACLLAAFALLLFTVNGVGAAAKQNPKDDFCRRYGHQTTVIDDKLYIDGGFVDFATFSTDHKDYPNTWLGFHDLNNLTTGSAEAWPQLNITLNKDPNVIPTVHGGVLWGDNVNKRFYVFGGEDTGGLATSDFTLLSYDILFDKWDDFGIPKLTNPISVASYGAGVGVSETGQGYYYGGWISNASTRGWSQGRKMSANFYKFEYDTNKTTMANSPDTKARAEGAMVWIPAGDTGLLVYFGGVVSSDTNATTPAPQPLDKIFVFDPSTNSWYTQTATGEVPQNRRQFCADAAWAPDRSSYNIYVWGGASVPPPVVNVSAFNDLYILSLPSFTWVKAFPDHHLNATYDYGHYAATCNMVKGNSQMFVIGGTYPGTDMCDLASDYWAQHNLFTGTKGNAGNNDAYWALYDPNVTSNVVPVDVYNVIGGDKNGGATMLSPKSGYDTPNGGLQTLLARKPTFAARSPTRAVSTAAATSSGVSAPTSTAAAPTTPSGPLSTGAIVGIAVGGAVVLGVAVFAWCVVGKRAARRRQERQMQRWQNHVSQGSHYGPSVASPQMTQGGWSPGPLPQHYSSAPPAELDVPRGMSTSPTVVSEPRMVREPNREDKNHISNINSPVEVGIPSPPPSESHLGTGLALSL